MQALFDGRWMNDIHTLGWMCRQGKLTGAATAGRQLQQDQRHRITNG